MLTTTQAAERLHVVRSRVRQLVRSGELPATRFGERGILIDEKDLEKFMKTWKSRKKAQE